MNKLILFVVLLVIGFCSCQIFPNAEVKQPDAKPFYGGNHQHVYGGSGSGSDESSQHLLLATLSKLLTVKSFGGKRSLESPMKGNGLSSGESPRVRQQKRRGAPAS
jgi:hypothetical protein